MKPYWLDANILIDAANGPYSFKRAPSYWTFLDAKLNDGSICSSSMVYRELVPYGDELAKWVKNRKQHGLCKQTSVEVQQAFTQVADYIVTSARYDEPNASDFLSGADAWLIAHVLVTGGTLVTNETSLHPTAKKVRIPDVCTRFEVRFINGFNMLDELSAVL